jgi:hypothetical protein
VFGRLESPLRVENALVEPSLKAHPLERFYIVRTLARDLWEVPMRVLNATCHDQKPMKGFPLAYCEPLALVTPPGVEQSQV